MNDPNESTQEVRPDGFIPVAQKEDQQPTEAGGSDGRTDDGKTQVSLPRDLANALPGVIEALERHVLVIALVGYILISIFGGMTNYGDFGRYVLFLCILSGISVVQRIEFSRALLKGRVKILIVVIVFLLLFILIEHWQNISDFLWSVSSELIKPTEVKE